MRNIRTMNCGDGHVRADTGAFCAYPAVVKLTDATLTTNDTGKCFTNRGAAGAIILTLPAAKQGVWFLFVLITAQAMTITATGGAKINGSAANGTFAVAAAQAAAGAGNASALMFCPDGVDWFVNVGSGTWTTT